MVLVSMLVAELGFGQQQQQLPLLKARRGVFSSKILRNNTLMSSGEVINTFEKEKSYKSTSLFKKSKVFVMAGPPVMATGIYVAYDAIKGTKMSINIDGVNVVYYKRPIVQLLGGIATFVVGGCLMEYGNEFKFRAVEIYNNKLISTDKAQKITFKAGLTPSNGLGFYAQF